MGEGAQHPTVVQERDRVARTPVYAAAALLVLLLASCAVITWAFMRPLPWHAGPPEKKPAPRELQRVDDSLFSAGLPARPDADEHRRTLESYGWVDRERRIVRIPIARAMDIVATEASGAR